MGIGFWLGIAFMAGLIVFACVYSVWFMFVGRRRGIPQELSRLTQEEKAYLCEEPHYVLLTREQGKAALRKIYVQLAERIGLILVIFVGVGIYKQMSTNLILLFAAFFVGMFGLFALWYRGITATGIHEVKAVCMNIASGGRRDGDIQYDFAYYDHHTGLYVGEMLISSRKDMQEMLEIGSRTHLLLTVRMGKWKVLDWKE